MPQSQLMYFHTLKLACSKMYPVLSWWLSDNAMAHNVPEWLSVITQK